ncbi:hypothetical protein TYRP_022758 [Tyrophagus putrescentiae]|nr:hypothetical protein TYRP_022758 [Tyrophagus putrescentiae]
MPRIKCEKCAEWAAPLCRCHEGVCAPCSWTQKHCKCGGGDDCGPCRWFEDLGQALCRCGQKRSCSVSMDVFISRQSCQSPTSLKVYSPKFVFKDSAEVDSLVRVYSRQNSAVQRLKSCKQSSLKKTGNKRPAK